MKKTAKFIVFIVILLIIIIPVFSHAQGGLVPPCGVDPITKQCVWGFKELMTLINKVINFVLFTMAVPIAAIMFAYAGLLMVTSGGSTESRSKAKSIFGNAVKGFLLAAGAWLIVNSLLKILGYDGAWIGF